MHFWRSSARFAGCRLEICNQRRLVYRHLWPAFHGRSLTQKLQIQVGSGEPEQGPLLSLVERQPDAQQCRVRKTDRLSAFEDCHDDIGCQAREVQQAIEANTAPAFEASDARDGLVSVQDCKLASLVNFAHQPYQFGIAMPEA